MMYDIKKKNYGRNTQFVANELACNVIDADETAEFIILGHIICVLIDLKKLTPQMEKNLETAIQISNEEKSFEIINLENKKLGGLGMRMIINLGYKIEYKKTKDHFYLIAFKEGFKI